MTPTVIFSAIQIAAYMGAARIGLLGVDMNYPPGEPHFYHRGPDQTSRPFGNCEQWFRPVFLHYHRQLNAKGLRLFNCTCRTREDVLPRMSLSRLAEAHGIDNALRAQET